MPEARPDISDVEALLGEVLAADMALLRHVNAQALAATDPETLNGYVRSQQRLARSVRTTLATRQKLRREARDDGRRATPPTGPAPALRPDGRPVWWDAQCDLEEAVEARIRLEYDPTEVEAIEVGALIDDEWEDGGYDRMLPADRLDTMMALIRETYGPSRTVAGPDAEPAKEPEAEPPAPEPAQTSPEATNEPYVPPWERRPRGARDRGGGSGW